MAKMTLIDRFLSNKQAMEGISPFHPEDPGSSGDRVVSSTRIAMIDRLRLLAMFEIVAFHAHGPLPVINGLGLPTFLLLSIAFSVPSVEKRGLRRVTSMKLRSIGIPWLFWWGIYAVFFVLLAIRHNAPPLEVFKPLMVLYGPSSHLWFCPFIILAGVIVAELHRWTRGHTHYWKAGVTLAIAFVLLVLLSSENLIHRYGIMELPEPFWQWYFSAPSLLLGLALGQVILMSRQDPRWMYGLALISVLIAGFSIEHLAVRHIFRRYAVSFAIITVAFVVGRWFPFRDRLTTKLTPTMLGVYLIHFIFVYILYIPLHNHLFLYALFTFAVSAGTVAIVRGTRLRMLV